MSRTPAERLWSRVDQSAGPTGCWLWMGGCFKAGYGAISVGGRMVLTHRLAYELSTGEPIPAGVQIDHICHVRRCCNPQHLRDATNKQNHEHLAGAHRDSRSGIRGVHQHSNGSWVAQVHHNGERVLYRYFATAEEAGEAARLKRLELFTHNDVDRSAS